MRQNHAKFLGGLGVVMCVALAASCGSGGTSHDQDQNGVLHASGKEDPLKNCASCHGSDLKGGSGPSCLQCHSSADHNLAHGGVLHRAGNDSSCTTCHGPNNTGGLGPACTQCH